MARLLDLSGEDAIEPEAETAATASSVQLHSATGPNLGLFSAALVCYPIVSQLARYLDLNSLHELSRTCRQFRASLLLYRERLIEQTLRCENENANPAMRLGNALHASHQVWTAYGRDGVKIGRITSGKVGACARDFVGGCRRCGRVICRNCVVKAPPTSSLKGRHRRLCRACMKSPLEQLTITTTSHHASDSSSSSGDDCPEERPVSRPPCTCTDGVWICQPCGQALRTADTTYMRGWVWRTRYSACGGLGAGLGEGNEGVECGRNADTRCLAAREVEHEVEYDDADDHEQGAAIAHAEVDGRQWAGSSYTTHEIVGIGGRVKKKIRKRVFVGAVVKEYEDERVSGHFLAREQTGANRSWCSWCARVVPGKKDKELPVKSTDSVASSSSASS